MKRTQILIVVALVLIAAGALPVYAHGSVHGSIWIGPVWGPWWGGWGPAYPYPYYYPYYQQPVIQQQAPVYEEQSPQQEQYYWYFCPDSKTYYPYVKQCPGGWLKVVPTPAPK